jgi:photosystem II stability/assembly factor-like uncharacterized protein
MTVMNRHKILCWLVAFLVGSAAVSLRAQGTAFYYQGKLNDGGSAANGNFDFQFSLYDAPTNGNLIAGPLTNLAVTVTSGLFATNIDFGAVFTGTNYWLAVGVRPNGNTNAFTVLEPRQPLLPVPYAIFANSASNLSGTLSAAQLSGTLPSTQLSGTYTGPVNFNNPGNSFSGSSFGTFSGNGSGLTNLNGTAIASGTVADARLSPNVALLNGNQTFTGSNVFTSVNSFTNRGNTFIGNFFGNGLVGWIPVSITSTQAIPDAGYLLLSSSLTTVTLPAMNVLTVGDIIRVSDAGAGGWQLAQNAGESIIGSFSGYGAASWLPSTATSPLPWSGMASSADGSLMAAAAKTSGQIYLSTDYGYNWSAVGPSGYTWDSVSISANGADLIAGQPTSGSIFYSTNYGNSWAGATMPNTGNWYAIALAANGNNAVAGSEGGGIYTSTNGGATWRVQGNAPSSATWSSVASSANGSNLVAVAASGLVYTSADGGFTWTGRTVGNGNLELLGVASSADGTKLVTVAEGGGIYISGNSGVNWQQTSAPNANWYSVVCSSDGGKLTAAVDGGGIYTSINFGSSWFQQSAPAMSWDALCASADGTHLAAGVYNGGIYYSSSAISASTTVGTTGYLSGSQLSAIELQYIGNGQFMPVSSAGSLWAK